MSIKKNNKNSRGMVLLDRKDRRGWFEDGIRVHIEIIPIVGFVGDAARRAEELATMLHRRLEEAMVVNGFRAGQHVTLGITGEFMQDIELGDEIDVVRARIELTTKKNGTYTLNLEFQANDPYAGHGGSI